MTYDKQFRIFYMDQVTGKLVLKWFEKFDTREEAEAFIQTQRLIGSYLVLPMVDVTHGTNQS